MVADNCLSKTGYNNQFSTVLALIKQWVEILNKVGVCIFFINCFGRLDALLI